MSDELKITGGARHVARIAAVQALYQIEQNPEDAGMVVNQFIYNRFKNDFKLSTEPDIELFKTITAYLQKNLNCFDEVFKKHMSEEWTLERMPSLTRAILRCAVFEIDKELETPIPVIINEYTEVANGFLEKKDVSFINGILQKISNAIRMQN